MGVTNHTILAKSVNREFVDGSNYNKQWVLMDILAEEGFDSVQGLEVDADAPISAIGAYLVAETSSIL